jgi:hypothetical protein
MLDGIGMIEKGIVIEIEMDGCIVDLWLYVF